MSPRTRARSGLIALALTLALACTTASPREGTSANPARPPQNVDVTLLLVGDAGESNPHGEPALQALAREAALAPERTVVVFLGDNVYPRGLPVKTSPGRAEAERRLSAQVDVCTAGCRTFFIPGNHDWAHHVRDGWEAVRRQADFLSQRGSSLLPGDGTPGPEVRDVGSRLRLVLLDTQWWLQSGPKPVRDEASVAASIREAIETAGDRQVAVLGHHPLVSGGFHGGHFPWLDYLFPVRRAAAWFWLPLPGIGSLYPLVRRSGVSVQDMSSGPYAHMNAVLTKALAAKPPLLYAAGHDHGLQVLDGPPARHLLVSGGGTYGEASPVGRIAATRFAAGLSGFMRLDVEEGGKVRLGVRIVEKSGNSREAYSTWLD